MNDMKVVDKVSYAYLGVYLAATKMGYEVQLSNHATIVKE